MVFGLWMHKFGVGFRGDSGPNAPIVLGTKSFNLSANYCVELDVNEEMDISQTYIVCWAQWRCGGLRCWPGQPGERSVHQPQTTGHWVEIFFSRQSYLNNDLRSKSWFFDKWNFISAKYLKCTSQSIRWLTTISWRHLKSSTSANRNGPLQKSWMRICQRTIVKSFHLRL